MNELMRIIRKIFTGLSPTLANNLMYRKQMKKKLNIKNPQTFNEKINYLKMYSYPKNKLIIKCSDKYRVREYVKTKGLEKYLIKLIGCWDNLEDIQWNELPGSFVLKCNHGCGYNIICKDKNKFDIYKAKKKLRKWIKEDFGKVSCERHYSQITKKIICEEFLEENIKDYKFFCFHGEPKFFYIAQNIDGDFHNMQADFFYPSGQKTEFERTDHIHFKQLPSMPNNLKEMLEVARKLSEDFEFVRVDLYNVKEKIYFSELTFSPCSGFMPLYPTEYDKEIGKILIIDNKE